MKATLALLLVLFSLSSFAQKIEEIGVTEEVIKLDDVQETNHGGTRRIILKLNSASPDYFKVKFKYHYHFTSKTLGTVYLGQGGITGYSTNSTTEYYDGKTSLSFDIGESSVRDGDELKIQVDISKPNKNTHGIKVVVKLLDEKGNEINGGKKLLGLLGRSYDVKKKCE